MKTHVWYLIGTARMFFAVVACSMTEDCVGGDNVKICAIWCAGLVFVLGEVRTTFYDTELPR